MGVPIGLLQDDFADNAESPTWGRSFVAGSASKAETGGQARLTLPSATAGTHQAYYWSAANYDLSNGICAIAIDTMVATGVAASAVFDLYLSSGNALRWIQTSNTLKAQTIVGGVTTDLYSVTWNATTYKYLRIREGGGNILFDSSSNGTSWTARAAVALPFAITDISVRLGAECGNVASPGSFRIEAVNAVLPAPSATWRETTADWSITNRLRPITMASDGGKQGVIVTADSMDSTRLLSGNLRYFAGPLGSSSGGYLALTEYASLVLAQASAFPIPVDGRVDLPALVDARFIRLYHRSIDASAHSVYEFVPRRIVQADDIEAESIRAINIGAGEVTADKIFVINLAAINADMGNLHMDGVIDIESTGGIYQGSGTFASPTTGLKLFNSGGVGKLSGYNGGTEQITLDTDGRLKWGAGAGRLDADGAKLRVTTSGSYAAPSALSWYDATFATVETYLWSDSSAGSQGLNLVATRNAGGTKYGTLKLTGQGTSADAEIIMNGALAGGAYISLNASDLRMLGGLNVGAATGAATGEIRASDKLRLNNVTTLSAQMRAITVANNGVAQLCNSATETGFVLIADNSGASAIFALTGGGHTTAEIADPSGTYSGTAASPGLSNIYWSGANSRFEIENKRGVSIDYRIFLLV